MGDLVVCTMAIISIVDVSYSDRSKMVKIIKRIHDLNGNHPCPRLC